MLRLARCFCYWLVGWLCMCMCMCVCVCVCVCGGGGGGAMVGANTPLLEDICHCNQKIYSESCSSHVALWNVVVSLGGVAALQGPSEDLAKPPNNPTAKFGYLRWPTEHRSMKLFFIPQANRKGLKNWIGGPMQFQRKLRGW